MTCTFQGPNCCRMLKSSASPLLSDRASFTLAGTRRRFQGPTRRASLRLLGRAPLAFAGPTNHVHLAIHQKRWRRAGHYAQPGAHAEVLSLARTMMTMFSVTLVVVNGVPVQLPESASNGNGGVQVLVPL